MDPDAGVDGTMCRTGTKRRNHGHAVGGNRSSRHPPEGGQSLEAAATVPVRGDHRRPRDHVRTWHFVEQLLGVRQDWVAGRVARKKGILDVEVAREAGLAHLRVHDREVSERGEGGEDEREGVAVGADAEAEEAAEERERRAGRGRGQGAEE